MQSRLYLGQGNKTLMGQQNGLVVEDQFAPAGGAANGDPNRALHLFGVDFVVGSIDMPRRFQQRRIGQSSCKVRWNGRVSSRIPKLLRTLHDN